MRVLHAVCNMAAVNAYQSLVALLNARQIVMASFRVRGRWSAHGGQDGRARFATPMPPAGPYGRHSPADHITPVPVWHRRLR